RTLKYNHLVLSSSTPCQTGDQLVGAGKLSLRRERRGRGREIEIRSVLYPALLTEAGCDDRIENVVHHGVWQRTVTSDILRAASRWIFFVALVYARWAYGATTPTAIRTPTWVFLPALGLSSA